MAWKYSVYIAALVAVLQYASSATKIPCDRYYNEHLILVYSYQNTLTVDCKGRYLESIPHHLDPGTKHLDLSSNSITKIENDAFIVINLTGLLNLNLSCNGITDIEETAFRGLTELQIMILDNNSITSLNPSSFEDSVNLRHLGLASNPILIHDSKPFLKIRSLETLDLSNCNLSTLPKTILQERKELQILKLNRNNFVDVDVQDFKNIRRLEYDSNKIKALQLNTFWYNEYIVFLSLSNNVLRIEKREPFIQSKSLQYLYINKCGIKNIVREHFANLTALEELHMDWNYLSVISKDSFFYLTKLRVLSLKQNRIKYLQSDTFQTNEHLSHLDLSGNYLSLVDSSFLELPSLTNLILSSCNISSLNNSKLFAGTANLQSLRLDSNNLEVISKDILENLKSLQYLNMSDNPLKCNRVLRMVWKWCKKNNVMCSAECNSPQGDWNMVRYLQFSESEYVKESSEQTTEELSLYFLALRCFIPFGALALLIGMVLSIRWLISFAILKNYQYNNHHYNYESDDSEQDGPYSPDTISEKTTEA